MQVLEVLQEARELVFDHWGTGNPNIEDDGWGAMCASVAISTAAEHDRSNSIMEAHVAVLEAAGLPVPDNEGGILAAVYEWNDAQTNRRPVVEAFDLAIAKEMFNRLGTPDEDPDAAETSEPTPNADAMLEVMGACDKAGEVVARYIVSEHPGMDLTEMQTLASQELFYAAQDCARVGALEAERRS